MVPDAVRPQHGPSVTETAGLGPVAGLSPPPAASSSIAATPRVATTTTTPATAARIVSAPAAAAPVIPGSVLALVGCTTCPAHEEGDAPAMPAAGALGIEAEIARRPSQEDKGNPADGQKATAMVTTMSIG